MTIDSSSNDTPRRKSLSIVWWTKRFVLAMPSRCLQIPRLPSRQDPSWLPQQVGGPWDAGCRLHVAPPCDVLRGQQATILGVDPTFFSTIDLFQKPNPFSLGFRFSRKKDPLERMGPGLYPQNHGTVLITLLLRFAWIPNRSCPLQLSLHAGLE